VHVASPTPVRMAWRTRHPGHLRSQTAGCSTLPAQMLHSVLDCSILASSAGRAVRRRRRLRARGRRARRPRVRPRHSLHRVPLRRGLFAPASGDLAHAAGCRHDGDLGVHEPARVHFIGTLMQTRDFRRAGPRSSTASATTSDPAPAADERSTAAVPCRSAAGAACLADHLLRRASTTSALWVQFRHLCDLWSCRRGEAARSIPSCRSSMRSASWSGRARVHAQLRVGDWRATCSRSTATVARASEPEHVPAPGRAALPGRALSAEHHVLEDLVAPTIPTSRESRQLAFRRAGEPLPRGAARAALSSFLAEAAVSAGAFGRLG